MIGRTLADMDEAEAVALYFDDLDVGQDPWARPSQCTGYQARRQVRTRLLEVVWQGNVKGLGGVGTWYHREYE